MKLVAVSQRVDFIQNRSELRDSLDHNYVNFLLKSGYGTVPIPNFNFASVDNDNSENLI